jgi:molybdopterin synthase catalytic subunit
MTAAGDGAARRDFAMTVRIQQDDFDVGAELAQLRGADPRVGAIASFVGLARDLNDGREVLGLTLEHYPGMTERALEAIVQQARQRWSLIEALIVHRIGSIAPLDQIVLVAVTSMHRHDAFEACRFLIDYLKTDAPFWKKEQTPQGSHWVEARATDEQARAAWQRGEPRE